MRNFKSVADLFDDSVKSSRPCVVFVNPEEGASFKYSELQQRVQSVCHKLVRYESLGKYCGVLLSSAMDRATAMLSILKCGLVYVPISEQTPKSRFETIAKNTDLRFIISSRKNSYLLKNYNLGEIEVIFLEDVELCDEEPITPAIKGGDSAYLMYTSGSTGNPKGVLIRHDSLSNHTLWMKDAYPLKDIDKFLPLAPISFDPSIYELLHPLVSGAQLYIAPDHVVRDMRKLIALIFNNKITVINFVPTLFRIFLEVIEAEEKYFMLNSLRLIFIGGEPLSTMLVSKARSILSAVKLVNLYGPTEACIDAMHYQISPEILNEKEKTIRLGSSVDHMRYYVLDNNLKRVSVNESGELYLSGIGLSSGYLNNSKLTEELFINNPFYDEECDEPYYKKMYKTGDCVRISEDGGVYFVGRIDSQLKISGVRVDPLEIEDKIDQLPFVNASCVLPNPNAANHLVSFVECNTNISEEEVNDHVFGVLSQEFPSYMIPKNLWIIKKLPLLSNGKVNRNLLKEKVSLTNYDNTEIDITDSNEEVIKKGLSCLLKLPVSSVDMNNSFIEAGGDSIKSLELAVWLLKKGYSIDPSSIFLVKSLSELKIEKNSNSDAYVDNKLFYKYFNHSDSLMGILSTSGITKSSNVYYSCRLISINCEININRLKKAIDEVHAKTVTLQQGYKVNEYGEVSFCLSGTLPELQYFDFSYLQRKEFNFEIKKVQRSDLQRGFILSNSAPYRFILLKQSDDFFVVLFSFHHVLFDGWSSAIYLNKLFHSYFRPEDSLLEDNEYLFYLKSLYNEKNVNRRNIDQYFDNRVSVDRLSLSVAMLMKESLGRLSFGFDEVTLSANVLAALGVALCARFGVSEITCGIAISDRKTKNSWGAIGLFIRTIPIKFDCKKNKEFSQLAEDVMNQVTYALSHQNEVETKYEVLISCDLSDLAKPYLFSIDKSKVQEISRFSSTPFPITIELYVREEDLVCDFTFNEDRYHKDDIESLFYQFNSIIRAIRKNSKEISFLYESTHMLSSIEDTDILLAEEGMPAWDTFLDSVRKHHNKHAIIDNNGEIDYISLASRAVDLSNNMKSLGIGVGSIVGLYFERSIDFYVALLAGMRLGVTCILLPIDTNSLSLESIVSDFGMEIVVTNNSLKVFLEDMTNNSVPVLSVGLNSENISLLNLDRLPKGCPTSYMIFTSGSTGKPKGILQHESTLINLSMWQNESALDIKRVAAFASFGFDVCLQEAFYSLLYGRSLYIVPDEARRDPGRLIEFLHRYLIEEITLLPSILEILSHQVESEQILLTCLKRIRCSGEGLCINSEISGFAKRHPWINIQNQYGPTETHVATSYNLNTNELSKVGYCPPIGKAISNMNAVILNENGVTNPPYLIGEIVIGGVGVAKGYLNIESNSFRDNKYYTGDLGYSLVSGEIVYCGRRDRQIKINGIRVDLDGITSTFLSCKEVRSVYLHVNEKIRSYVAYCVLDGKNCDKDLVVSKLEEMLMKHELPQKIIFVSEIPLTDTGKVDEKKLLNQFDVDIRGELIAYDKIEKKYLDFIASYFGIPNENICNDDDLFSFGLTSLSAMRFVAEFNRYFNKKLSVMDLYKFSKVSSLLGVISKSTVIPTPDISHSLSDEQRSLVFMDKIDKTGCAYNVPLVLELVGDIDVTSLTRSVERIIEENSILNATVENKEFVCNKLSSRDIFLVREVMDTGSIDFESFASHKFDIGSGPLCKINLYVCERKVYLCINLHHIITDDQGLIAIVSTLSKIYRNEDVSAKIAYIGEATEKKDCLHDLELRGLVGATPITTLQSYAARPKEFDFLGDSVFLKFDDEWKKRLDVFCRKNRITPFGFFASVLFIVLQFFSQQNDLIVGTSCKKNKEKNCYLGLNTSSIPLRACFNYDMSVTEWLDYIMNIVFSSLKYSNYSFESILSTLGINRDLSMNPLFQVAIFESEGEFERFFDVPGIQTRSLNITLPISKFDLALYINCMKNKMQVRFEYATSILNDSLISSFVDCFENCANKILDNTVDKIGDLNILPGSQLQLLRLFGSGEVVHNYLNKTIYDFIDWEYYSSTVAVVEASQSITYCELRDLIAKYCYALLNSGIKSGDLVAFYMPKNINMFASMLAALRIGAIIVPIDMKMSILQVRHIIEKGVKFGLCQVFEQKLTDLGKIKWLNVNDFDFPGSIDLPSCPSPDSIAYIIHTSGSTGMPKGVCVTHENLASSLMGTLSTLPFSEGNSWLAQTPLIFDISFHQLLMPLVCGGKVILISEKVSENLQLLKNELLRDDVDYLSSTPTLLRSLLKLGWKPARKQNILSVGEPLDAALAEEIVSHNAALFNYYGPSETTIYSCGGRVTSEKLIHIGKPIANTELAIVSESGDLMPFGARGNLLIGGPGVMKGYWEDRQQTDAAFLYQPLAGLTSKVWYRSGDCASWSHDGSLILHGRLDSQVKIFGVRVEIDAIESALRSLPGIVNAALIHIDNSIVAFVVREVASLNSEAIKDQLSKIVSGRMLPNNYEFVKALPILKNGKVDYQKLKQMFLDGGREKKEVPFPLEGSAKALLLHIWRGILKNDSLSYSDNFFSFGGNSVLAVELKLRIESALAIEINISDIFDFPSVNEFYRNFQSEGESSRDSYFGNDQKIAVVGVSLKLPGVNCLSQLWEKLSSPLEDALYKSKILGDLDQFDADLFKLSLHEATQMNPQIRKLLESAWELLYTLDYKYDEQKPVGTYLAVGNKVNEEKSKLLKEGRSSSLVNDNLAANQVAYHLNLTGPAITLNTACSSSLVAIIKACQDLKEGIVPMALAGGVSLIMPENGNENVLESCPSILSKVGRCRPLDIAADGTMESSGLGLVMLKPYCQALNDGDNIYGVIEGYGLNNDGKDKANFASPSRKGQVACLRSALGMAGIYPENVDVVELHGTGTPIGDPIEVAALKDAYKSTSNSSCYLTAAKSYYGHTDSAAGVLGVISMLQMMVKKSILPIKGFSKLNKHIKLQDTQFKIADALTPWDTSGKYYGSVSSFGVGGTNSHIVISNGNMQNIIDNTLPEFDQRNQCLTAHTVKNNFYNLKEIIKSIWMSHLIIKDIDDNDDFYDLGGSSLTVIDVLHDYKERLSVNLSIDQFMECSRLGEQVWLIESGLYCENGEGNYRYLLKADQEEGVLVLIHPVGGNIFSYDRLVKVSRFPEGMTVIGMSVDPCVMQCSSIEEVAAKYIESLKKFYMFDAAGKRLFLGGWSYGGVVAYQMSLSLNSCYGYQPPVIMIDSWPCLPVAYYSKDVIRSIVSSYYMERVGDTDNNEIFDELFERTWHCMCQLLRYQPEKSNIPVLLLKARELLHEYQDIDQCDNSWGRYTQCVEAVTVSGDHNSILEGGSLCEVSAILESYFEKVAEEY